MLRLFSISCLVLFASACAQTNTMQDACDRLDDLCNTGEPLASCIAEYERQGVSSNWIDCVVDANTCTAAQACR